VQDQEGAWCGLRRLLQDWRTSGWVSAARALVSAGSGGRADLCAHAPLAPPLEVCTCAAHHLWTPLGWISQQEFDDLNTFVTNLLRERDLNAPLDVCELIINPFENVVKETEISKIRTWIQQALLCKAQTLRILFDEPDYSSLMLRHLHLVSHYLTTLELKCVRLGNDFLDFSSCLTLKNLRMYLCYIWSEKISSHSLKQLTIIHCWFRDHKRTRISAPNLVWLELSNNHRKTPILESMPSLVKALVRLRDCLDHCGKEEFGGSCSKNNCINCVHNSEKHQGCVLLNGLSQAERLELVAGAGTVYLYQLPFILFFDNLFLLWHLYCYLAYTVIYVWGHQFDVLEIMFQQERHFS
jgi:hypothetical protein